MRIALILLVMAAPACGDDDVAPDAAFDADVDANVAGLQLILEAPRTIPVGERIPFRVMLVEDSQRHWAHDPLEVRVEAGANQVRVTLVRGNAAGWIASEGATELRASFGELESTRAIELVERSERTLTGSLRPDDLRWGPDAVVRLSGVVTVPSGETLVVAPGTHVRLDADARVEVLGDLDAQGLDDPITFLASDADAPFSMIHVVGSATLDAAFVSGGGAGPWTHAEFRHCCMPMLYVEGGTLTVSSSVFFDSPNAKGILTENTEVVIRDSMFQGMGFGTEHFNEPPHTVLIEDSAYRELRGDDDDDGIYFWELGDAQVRRVTISGVDDDAIDSESATPLLEDVLIEDAADKCVSVTNEGPIVRNAFFRACRVGVKVDGITAAPRFERVTMVELLEEGVRLSDREGSMPDARILPVFEQVILGPVRTPLRTDYDPLDASFFRSVLPAELGTRGEGNVVASPDLEAYEPAAGSAGAILEAGFRPW